MVVPEEPSCAARKPTVVSDHIDWDGPKRSESYRKAAAETEAAIRRGADVVYQAAFFDGRWFGIAPSLLRVDKPSNLRNLGLLPRLQALKTAAPCSQHLAITNSRSNSSPL
jgi:hypothetical protein